MKVENFKMALKKLTDISYKFLEERFDPEFVRPFKCNNLEDLISRSPTMSSVIDELCDWRETPESNDFWDHLWWNFLNIADETSESEKDFKGTVWDVRDWTTEQKSKFQEKCFELGYVWASERVIKYLDMGFYQITQGRGYLGYGNDPENVADQIKSGVSVEKKWEDMFPHSESTQDAYNKPACTCSNSWSGWDRLCPSNCPDPRLHGNHYDIRERLAKEEWEQRVKLAIAKGV